MIRTLLQSSAVLAICVATAAAAQSVPAAPADAQPTPQPAATDAPPSQPTPEKTEQLSTDTDHTPTKTVSADQSGEIVVTATRRTERLRDVPLSITALSQSQLTKAGTVGYASLARETPGVVLNQPTENFGNFTARGIATNSYGANLQSTVAIYQDELPISTTGNASILDPGLYDVERVEFLRGPQGTLFGSGSLSGALRILTKSPDLTKWDVSGQIDEGGTQGGDLRQRYNGMVNVPIVDDKLALRLVGFYRDEGGYVDNIGTGIKNANRLKDRGGRAILLYKPTERLSVRLLGSYENSFPKDSSLTNPALGDEVRSTLAPDVFSVKQTNLNATVDYQFDGAHFTSSSTYSHLTSNFNVDISNVFGGAAPYLEQLRSRQNSFVEEARLASDTGSRFEWLVGLFYLDRGLHVDNDFMSTEDFLAARGITGAAGPNGTSTYIEDTSLRSHELAGFGQATYHLNDRLWLTGGLRYGRTDARTSIDGGFQSSYIVQALFGTPGQLTTTPFTPTTLPKIKDSRPSYKASISFKPTTQVTTYATISTGYRAPYQNANAGQVSQVNPNDIIIPAGATSDKLTNYEVGAKGRFLNGQINAAVALYWITWDNIEVNANRVSDQIQFATNIGGARSRGIEFELSSNPNRLFSFGANGSYDGTRITKLTAEQASISGAVKGDRLSAPKFQGTAYAQMNFTLRDIRGDVRAALEHVGSYPNALRNIPGQPGVQNPAYGFTDTYNNVNLALELRKGLYSATLYAENAANSHAITYLHPEEFINARATTLRPRTIGVRLGYNL